jgi:uncharacterized protein YdhG (YjbR/CyaY superfamily)
MNTAIKDIDTYISMQSESVQPVLDKLRQTIKAMAPDAEEVISYGMPAFKWKGMLVGFAAAKQHIGFYPWNSSTVELFKDALKAFETSKGTIRFALDKPLPVALIKKIVKSRMKENILKKSN